MTHRSVRPSAGRLVGGLGMFLAGWILAAIGQASRGADFLILLGLGTVVFATVMGLIGLHQLATNLDYLADREANRHEMEIQAAQQ